MNVKNKTDEYRVKNIPKRRKVDRKTDKDRDFGMRLWE